MPKIIKKLNKEELEGLFKWLEIKEIAMIKKISYGTVYNWLLEYEIIKPKKRN